MLHRKVPTWQELMTEIESPNRNLADCENQLLAILSMVRQIEANRKAILDLESRNAKAIEELRKDHERLEGFTSHIWCDD